MHRFRCDLLVLLEVGVILRRYGNPGLRIRQTARRQQVPGYFHQVN